MKKELSIYIVSPSDPSVWGIDWEVDDRRESKRLLELSEELSEFHLERMIKWVMRKW